MSQKYKTGDKVRYINARIKTSSCPPAGTVGEVIAVAKFGIAVQWPNGTTAGDGRWWHAFGNVEPVEDGQEVRE